MKFLLKTLIIAPVAVLFLSTPAHPHGGEEGGGEHSTPKLVGAVVEESAHGLEGAAHGAGESTHGGENHHVPDMVESTMEGESDNHGVRQRVKKYVAEELHQAALNKAKAEAAERKAMEETGKLTYRTAAAVFGIFILVIGLVLRYAPGRVSQ